MGPRRLTTENGKLDELHLFSGAWSWAELFSKRTVLARRRNGFMEVRFKARGSNMVKTLYSIEDAAREIGVSQSVLWGWLSQGQIEALGYCKALKDELPIFWDSLRDAIELRRFKGPLMKNLASSS